MQNCVNQPRDNCRNCARLRLGLSSVSRSSCFAMRPDTGNLSESTSPRRIEPASNPWLGGSPAGEGLWKRRGTAHSIRAGASFSASTSRSSTPRSSHSKFSKCLSKVLLQKREPASGCSDSRPSPLLRRSLLLTSSISITITVSSMPSRSHRMATSFHFPANPRAPSFCPPEP